MWCINWSHLLSGCEVKLTRLVKKNPKRSLSCYLTAAFLLNSSHVKKVALNGKSCEISFLNVMSSAPSKFLYLHSSNGCFPLLNFIVMILDKPPSTYFKMSCAVYVMGHKKHHKMSAQCRQTLNLGMAADLLWWAVSVRLMFSAVNSNIDNTVLLNAVIQELLWRLLI